MVKQKITDRNQTRACGIHNDSNYTAVDGGAVWQLLVQMWLRLLVRRQQLLGRLLYWHDLLWVCQWFHVQLLRVPSRIEFC